MYLFVKETLLKGQLLGSENFSCVIFSLMALGMSKEFIEFQNEALGFVNVY